MAISSAALAQAIAVSVSTATSGPGVFADTLAYTCAVTNSSGAAVTDPSCAPASSSAIPGGTVSYTLTSASSSTTPGQYNLTVTATDPKAPTLTYSITKPVSIVNTTQQQSFTFSGIIAQTAQINFATPAAGISLSNFWCPQIKQTAGSPPSGVTANPFPNQSSFTATPAYLTCSGTTTTTTAGTTPIAIQITPIASTATAQNRQAGGVYLAMVFGSPVLILLGWCGRNRARKNFFRMMTVLVLAWGALTISGCGGGYHVSQNGQSSPPTKLPVGSYQVLVEAQDSTQTNTVYAIVTLSVN